MSFKMKAAMALKTVGRKISAKSPTIMVVTGTIGLIAAGVIAAKKSATELNQVLEEHNRDKEKLKEHRNDLVAAGDAKEGAEAEKQYRRLITALYIRTGKKLVKVYGPALVLAILSVASIFGGHKILTKRHLAAIAECYGVRETLNEYRKRVAGKIGDEAEELLWLGGDKEIVTEDIPDEKTGEVKTESSEQLHGQMTKGVYRYICSRETMKPHAWYDFEQRQVRYLQQSVESIGNSWLEGTTNQRPGEYITLIDIMKFNWKQEYLQDHPEVFTDGWWVKNPYAAPLDLIHPIVMNVKKISAPGEEPKYEVIFNAQGNIVMAMELAKKEQRETVFRSRKRPRGRIKPAAAIA